MEQKSLIKLLSGLGVLIVLAIVAIFGASIIYVYNPGLFNASPVSTSEWTPKTIDNELPSGKDGQLIKYGYALISESPKWMGPMMKNPELRYTGNNLACKNCHLQNGTQRGSASWIGVPNRFPQFRGRENQMGTIEDRVNGCMERSMNGKKLPKDSKQMQAIVAYMEWISKDIPEDKLNTYKGFTKLEIPDVAASPEIGKAVYDQHCVVCHGDNGAGKWLADSTKGYQYPPLWGDDTYNHGAGMHRVLTAAQFIKANMPWGAATKEEPVLSDEEAYHVAAYINSFKRPEKANAELDFPDRKLKPVSTPYGPWDDNFTAEQHKYGPYKPIIDYYKEKYDINKTK